ncbi:MAG: helicase-related protein [Desulfurispora sp.]|uniref:helicase-related protein n=1 Tax=Desulfurispora sp. TaxID=3014275 RepID=UPI00404B345B
MANLGSSPSCVEVVQAIEEHLPALYFTFGRAKTELLAEELGREWDFLTAGEKRRVNELIIGAEEKNPGLFGPRRANLRLLLQQGIAYHHAGLAPALKDLVERLYEQRLIYVLFCTETFAVGVNFPAASTVFDTCRKWDGREFRSLLNREFFQMAGRAGRRGYDAVGRVYIRMDQKYIEQTGFYSEKQVEPVYGRLMISPNTVLSLIYWKTDEEINRYLEQNLSNYQKRREERQLRQELAVVEQKLAGIGQHFCQEIYTPACQLLRLKLKKELQSLSRSRKRRRPGSKERREEIRHILKARQRDCNYRLCVEASQQQTVLQDKRSRLSRRLRALERHARDYEVEFNRVWDLLEALDYVDGRQLLPRGLFALHLHVQEILVTELVFNGIIRDQDPAFVAAVLAGVDYIPGRDETTAPCAYDLSPVAALVEELRQMGVPEHFRVWSPLPAALAAAWCEGASFENLLAVTSLQEGDVFSLLRRTIDLLRQIERAAGQDVVLRRQMESIRRALDRDEVAVLGI